MNDGLFTRLHIERDLSSPRKWIGNDDSQYHHHGLVPFDEAPFEIVLQWKSSKMASPKLVGCYRLNLRNLCIAGYVSEPRNGKVRLRFFHAPDDSIYIQRLGANAPMLVIGKFQPGDTN